MNVGSAAPPTPMASKGKTTATQKLAALAAELEPKSPPFYVRRRDLSLTLQRHFPSDGWYWTPQAADVAVWLAQTFDEAAYHLRRLVERQELEQER